MVVAVTDALSELLTDAVAVSEAEEVVDTLGVTEVVELMEGV